MIHVWYITVSSSNGFMPWLRWYLAKSKFCTLLSHTFQILLLKFTWLMSVYFWNSKGLSKCPSLSQVNLKYERDGASRCPGGWYLINNQYISTISVSITRLRLVRFMFYITKNYKHHYDIGGWKITVFVQNTSEQLSKELSSWHASIP